MAWVFLSDSFPKASKPYRCDGCYERIEIGEKHLARRGIGDDGYVTSRWHPECEKFAFLDGPNYDLAPGAFSRAEAIEAIAAAGEEK